MTEKDSRLGSRSDTRGSTGWKRSLTSSRRHGGASKRIHQRLAPPARPNLTLAVRGHDRVCICCGSSQKLEVHHRVPLAEGESNSLGVRTRASRNRLPGVFSSLTGGNATSALPLRWKEEHGNRESHARYVSARLQRGRRGPRSVHRRGLRVCRE